MTRTDLTIRRAQEKDVPALVELNYALFQEDAGQRDPFMNLNWPREEGHAYFMNHIHSETSLGWLAEMKGTGIGYLIGYVKPDSSIRLVKTAELESMYVTGAYRRWGVGRQLVRQFLEWAREQRAERVSVTAYAANEGAVSFYQALGFLPKSITLESGS